MKTTNPEKGRKKKIERIGTNHPDDLSKITFVQEEEKFYRCKDLMCGAFMVEHYHKVKTNL